MKNKSEKIKENTYKKSLHLISGPSYSIFIIFAYSIVQLFRFGNISNYLILLIGSIVTFISFLITTTNIQENGLELKKGLIPMLLSIFGLIPWVFGIYIILINGFSPLINLINGFSFLIFLKSVIFIYLGYVIVNNNYKIIQLGNSSREHIKNLEKND